MNDNTADFRIIAVNCPKGVSSDFVAFLQLVPCLSRHCEHSEAIQGLQYCHPERSEGPPDVQKEILRFAQDDSIVKSVHFVCWPR